MGSCDRSLSSWYTSCPLLKTKSHTLPALSAGLAEKQRFLLFLCCLKPPLIHYTEKCKCLRLG